MRDEKDEINYWTGSELLDGKPDKYDRHRRINWCGLSKDEHLENFNGLTGVAKQVKQAAQDRKTEIGAEIRDIEAAKMSEHVARLTDLEDKRHRLGLERKLQAENQAKSQEDKIKNDFLRREVYGMNQPSRKYWSQFGISGR